MRAATLIACVTAVACVACAHAQDAEPYRLGAEDVLRILVPGNPSLSVDVAVESDGRIRVPEIGAVNATGRTATEVGEELVRRYNILHPAVSEVLVSVLQYNSRRITIVGEVRNPGTLGFRVIPDLVQVILRAGGPTAVADLSNVRVVRQQPAEGEEAVLSVDLSDGLLDTDPSTLPTLQPQDTIVVPVAEGPTIVGETFQVLGAVAAPGVYALRDGTTVIKALAVAGGASTQGNLRKVHLTRETETGVVAYQLDVERHLSLGMPGANFEMRPGDTITVPTKSSVWSQVFSGFLAIAPVITAISTVTIAINR